MKKKLVMSARLAVCIVLAGLPLGGHGLSGEALGFCIWNPLLSLNDDFCWKSSGYPDLTKTDIPHPTPTSSATANETTGWDGPRHCIREYCVYSNRQFSGGIVVITDSANAKRIADLPHLAIDKTIAPPYYATEVPGKGIGLVANRTIPRGEPIMTWQPTYMIHRRLTDELTPSEQQHILDAALLKLPAPRRRAFSRQLGQFGGHKVSDILLTNSFQMAVDSGEAGHHLGNFPDVSRFNHDCRPNVAFRIDDRTLAHHTHAVREIQPGEELTLAYMNPFETRAVRQQHILSSWGFQCTCPHCTMGEEEVAASDGRLYEIEELEKELGDFGSKKASTKMVERLLRLYEMERLDVKMHGPYVLAALNYNLFGDAKKARKYAEL